MNVSGREYGKSYSYLLTACAGSGSDGSDGSEKDESCETRDESGALEIEVKPARLAGLVIDESNSTDGEYSLDWTIASADPGSYYKIEERSRALGGSFGDWSALSSENANSYSIDKPGSAFERDYEYRVSLCAANHVCGEPSASVALSLRFEKPSLTVDGTIKASGEYSLGWSGVTKAASYVTQVIDKAANCPPSPSAAAGWSGGSRAGFAERSPSLSEQAISGKEPGEGYCHIAKACNGGVCGSWSAVYEAEVPDLEWPEPGNPIPLSSDQTDEEDNEYRIILPLVDAPGVDSYKLISWESDLGEAGAEPDWSAAETISDANGDGSLSDDERGKSIPPMSYRKSYHYRAKACAGSNCTGPSPVLTVHVSYSQPALSLTGDVPKGAYTLSWSAASTAPKYVLRMREKRRLAADYGGWSVIGDYEGNADDSYNTAAALSAHKPRADSDYEYRLGACARALSEAGFNFDGDCTASAEVSASVPKPTLTFRPGSISLDGTDPSGRSSYTLDWGDSGSTESLKSVDTYELQEHIGVIPPGGSFSVSDTHRPTEGSKAIAGKEHGPAYSYRVRACVDYNSNGQDSDDECGPWSDIKEVDATELSGGPGLGADITQTHVRLASGDNYWSWLTSYDLAWQDAPSEYASYLEPSELQECIGANCDEDTAVWTDLSSAGLRASASNKTPGESYSYRIRLCNKNDLNNDGTIKPEKCGGYSYARVDVLVLKEGPSGLTSGESPDQTVSNDGVYTISWNVVKDTRDLADAQVYVLTEISDR